MQTLGIIAVAVLSFLAGVFSKFGADWLTDWRKDKATDRARLKAFEDCQKQMPELFAEMRKDIEDAPLVREFILLNHGVCYNGSGNRPLFNYEFEKHNPLKPKVELLVRNGFAVDIAFNDVDRYQMTDEFVAMLKQYLQPDLGAVGETMISKG